MYRHEAGEDRMLELLTIMSDNDHDHPDHDHPLIRNEDTLQRRAWIDRALAGVRDRLKPAELGEAPARLPEPAPPEAAVEGPANASARDPGRSRLYLVRNPKTR